MGALDSAGKLIVKGKRLRLLCHCRPHVRCHCEYLKVYFDSVWGSSVPSFPALPENLEDFPDVPEWPGCGPPDGPSCIQCGLRGQVTLDPGCMKSFCCFCW